MKRFAIIVGKILLAIISVLLCIALFATTLVTMLVADVRVATNKDNLANLLKQTLSAPTQQMQLGPITSTAALLICIGACAVLVGLLFLCAWNKPYKAMIYAGVPVFLAGSLFLVPTLIAWLAPGTWLELFSFEPMVGMVSRFILMLTGGVCGTVTFLGIALFVGGIVLGVYMRKQAKTQTEPEELPAEEIPAAEEPV